MYSKGGHVGVCTVKAGPCKSLYIKVKTCKRLYSKGMQVGVCTVSRAK